MKKRIIMYSLTAMAIVFSTGFVYADDLQDSFLKDMAAGLTERWAYDDEVNADTMTASEKLEFWENLVNREYEKLEKYKEEKFESAKFDLMAHAYIYGLETQLYSVPYTIDMPVLRDAIWGAGYDIRANIIPDFYDLYGLDVDKSKVDEFRNSSSYTIVETVTDNGTEYSVINNTETDSSTASDTGTDSEDDEKPEQEEIELFNDEGITVVMTGMNEPDLYSTRFNLRIENLNHHDIYVTTVDSQIVLNGNMTWSPLYAEVKSGKTSNTPMEFYKDNLKEAGVDEIEELSFTIAIKDAENYHDLYIGEEVFLKVQKDGHYYTVHDKEVYTDKDSVQQVQELLNAAGYDCGAADGIPGKKTNSAILQFEKDHNLPENTDITPELVETLRSAAE